MGPWSRRGKHAIIGRQRETTMAEFKTGTLVEYPRFNPCSRTTRSLDPGAWLRPVPPVNDNASGFGIHVNNWSSIPSETRVINACWKLFEAIPVIDSSPNPSRQVLVRRG
jgi:hypothetical protein